MAQKIFPQSYIAQGPGDLIQATNVNMDAKNGAKQVHTLRRPGAGITRGPLETTVTFELAIDEDGPERDFFGQMIVGEIIQLRIKAPGNLVFVLNGAYSAIQLQGPLDDKTVFNVTFVGKLDRPQALAA